MDTHSHTLTLYSHIHRCWAEVILHTHTHTHTHTQALDGEALEEGGQKEDVDGEVCIIISSMCVLL